MPQYKLTYFPFRAKGENIRQIFALAGVKFIDNRLPKSEWPPIKHTTPFGQLPVLEVDGKQLGQSKVISRYLAKQFGLAGANDWESALLDSIADQYEDYWTEVRPFFVVARGTNEGEKDKLYKEIVVPATDKYFTVLVKFLKESGSGYLVGDSPSWVDLLIAEHVHTYRGYVPEFASNFPEILAHEERIHSIPNVRKWYETRPKTDF